MARGAYGFGRGSSPCPHRVSKRVSAMVTAGDVGTASPDSVCGRSGPTPEFVRDVSHGFSIADHCCDRDPDGTKVGTPRAGTSGMTVTNQRRRNELYGGEAGLIHRPLACFNALMVAVGDFVLMLAGEGREHCAEARWGFASSPRTAAPIRGSGKSRQPPREQRVRAIRWQWR